jgi:hypothetical protein
MKLGVIAVALACASTPALAQNATAPQTDTEWRAWVPDPASVTTPDLSFAESEEDIKNYDKYFYFHREDTGFLEALGDIRECDARARKMWQADAVDKREDLTASAYGLVGAAAQELIFGPAQDRLFRRANMRRCMFYKGYSRYGLAKLNWEAFNFQHVDRDWTEADIQATLVRQALVASGPAPRAKELGL